MATRRSELKAEQGYYVAKDDMYFWTPDGEGGFWYDTIEEMNEQHGVGEVVDIDELLDY